MTEIEIKSLDMIALGKIYGAMGAIMGIIFGLFVLLLGGMAAQLGLPAGGVLTGGLVTTIIVIIFYAIGGFVSGIIMALIYNIIAKYIGGIKFEY